MWLLAMHVPQSKRGAPGGAIDFLAQPLESQSAVPESICASMTHHRISLNPVAVEDKRGFDVPSHTGIAEHVRAKATYRDGGANSKVTLQEIDTRGRCPR